MTLVHIHAPKPTDRAVITTVCPDCNKRTRMLALFTEWYGWYHTCLRCGRNWGDGEWIPFEFYRFARRDSIESAKKAWRRMRGQQ